MRAGCSGMIPEACTLPLDPKLKAWSPNPEGSVLTFLRKVEVTSSIETYTGIIIQEARP